MPDVDNIKKVNDVGDYSPHGTWDIVFWPRGWDKVITDVFSKTQ